MANITLADYVGYIFSEITRARDHADRVSKEIAELYAKDDILKSFSVPRFKIPEMELTIPVIISGARFSETVKFNMSPEDFRKLITGKIDNAIRTILINKTNLRNDFTLIKDDIFIKPIFDRNVITRPIGLKSAGKKKAAAKESAALSTGLLKADLGDPLLTEFYEQLVNNPDPTTPDNIIAVRWAAIFNKKIQEHKLLQEYKAQNPKNELFLETMAEIKAAVKQNTIVSSTKIENILVNPETNAVKNQSTDATVFTIKAKIMEEGIFVKTITDEQGTESKVVEFE